MSLRFRVVFALAWWAAVTWLLTGCASIPRGRAAIDEVEIRGNDALSSGDIEDKIATMESPKFLLLFRGLVLDYEIFDRYVLQRDLERIERLYRARGFYEARVRAGRVIYVSDQHVRVEIDVEEGKPVNVVAVRIDGLDDVPRPIAEAARDAALAKVPIGRRFEEEAYADAEAALKRALTDRGYAWAKVTREADVDLPRHAATIVFTVAPDRPAKLGKITIEGLGSLPEAPVRRALDLEEGEVYSTLALENAQRAVLDLGVFAAVDIDPKLDEPPPEDRVVPIHVKVTPTQLHTVRLGGGVELDVIKTDVHLLAGWEAHNFLGGMRRFGVTFKPALVLWPTRLPDFEAPTKFLPAEKLRLDFAQPGLFEARTNGIVRTELNVYPVLITPNVLPDSRVLGYREIKAATGVNRTIWKLFAELTYNYQLEFPFAYVGSRDPFLSNISIGFFDLLTQFDFRDDPVRPHAGIFLGNDLQFAPGLVGNARDVKVQPEVRGYIPVSKKVTLALRGTVGFLFPSNYGDLVTQPAPDASDTAAREAWTRDTQIMYFRAFFSGGPSSNRGYPLRGVGPHGIVPFFTPQLATQGLADECDPAVSTDIARCGVPLGGATLWEASAELRYPISGPVTSATFCDASDVSQERLDLRLSRPHLSCGLGFRYDTPVGPIRLDVAYRIPGLQVLGGVPPSEGSQPTFFGTGFPLAFAFGIGEAF